MEQSFNPNVTTKSDQLHLIQLPIEEGVISLRGLSPQRIRFELEYSLEKGRTDYSFLFIGKTISGKNKYDAPLEAIIGQLPLPHERPNGCNFGPRCPHFEENICSSDMIQMELINNNNDHYSRCAKINKINWNIKNKSSKKSPFSSSGGTLLKIQNLSKDYDVAANVVFGGKKKGTINYKNGCIRFVYKKLRKYFSLI